MTVVELGLTLASAGPTGAAVAEFATRAERLGYRSLSSSESWGGDVFTPLACAATATTDIALGTGIAQISARTPAATAMASLALQQLSGGRLLLGLGVSGPVVVEGWHGVPFGTPLLATREYIAVLRTALAATEPLEFHGDVYDIPFRGAGSTGLGRPLRAAIAGAPDTPILVAAVGSKNVRQAVEVADGLLPFLWSPTHWKDAWGDAVAAAADGFRIACSVWVAIGDDVACCRDAVRPLLARYLGGMGAKGKNFYASLVASYGYEDAVERVQDLYLDGHRKDAIAVVPDDLVEELALVGEPSRVRERLHAWANGPVTTLIADPLNAASATLLAELNSWTRGSSMDLTVDERLAIQDLLAKYQVYMDRHDEGWVDLFDDSASFEVAGKDPLQKAHLKQFFYEAPRGVHLASAPVIQAGADEGSARTTQTFLFRNAQTEAFRTGYYDDELVRRDGTWRFKVRRVEFFDV